MFEKFNSSERTIDSRLADFELKNGDILVFEEYDPGRMEYTGREASFECKKWSVRSATRCFSISPRTSPDTDFGILSWKRKINL